MEAAALAYLEGWYPPEIDESGSFRWMQRAAAVSLPDCPAPGKKYVSLIAGHTFPHKANPLLSIFVNGKPALQKAIPASFHHYFLAFDDIGDIRLDFKLDNVFKIPEDPRDLGIIVREIEILSPQQADIIYVDGWYSREKEKHFDYRWMSPEARVLLPGRQLEKNRFLGIQACSEYNDFSQILQVSFAGQNIASIPLLPNWNYYSLALPVTSEAASNADPGRSDFEELHLSLNKNIPAPLRKGDSRDLGLRVNCINFHADADFHEDFLFFYKNAYLNYQEMLAGKIKLDSFPPQLGIDLYGKCNIKPPCVYCEWDWMKEVEGEYAQTVVDDKTLEDYGPFFRAARNLINCSIGEPLIHPRLKQILDFCEKHKKVLEMATNGQALTPRTIEALVGKRIDLYISLDAASGETYEKIRNDRWDAIIPNLILLGQERKKANNLPRIFMVFMPMRVNKDELEEYFRLCQKLEADHLILRPLNFLYDPKFEVRRGGYCFNYEKEMLSREELEDIFKKSGDFSKKYRVMVGNQFDFGRNYDLHPPETLPAT